MPLESRLQRLDRRHPVAVQRLRGPVGRVLAATEKWLFGGPRRERLLLRLLGAYYASQHRRSWWWRSEPPHFYDQRTSYFDVGFGSHPSGPYGQFRGMLVADLIQPGDRLLDIGCGDGFFTARFFSPRCSRVDAVDIESEAIEAARRFHTSPNVTYTLLDAVADPFPASEYDVIVWDGALGHFKPETNRQMLAKIRDYLAPGGVFAGSESLGREGPDHEQYFFDVSELVASFAPSSTSRFAPPNTRLAG